MPHRTGVMFRPEWPPEELPAFARRAEDDGFDELWLVEDCFLVGGLTMAATGLALTDRLRVGIGLLPAAMRNAALAAMEIAGLGRLHPGRLAVAFGHGVEPWMRQIDARPPDRLAALEEVVSAVRALLRGSNVSADGAFVRLEDVQLQHLPDPPPAILIGTTGPRALAVAGRSADGFLLAEGSGPPAVEWATDATLATSESASRLVVNAEDKATAPAACCWCEALVRVVRVSCRFSSRPDIRLARAGACSAAQPIRLRRAPRHCRDDAPTLP